MLWLHSLQTAHLGYWKKCITVLGFAAACIAVTVWVLWNGLPWKQSPKGWIATNSMRSFHYWSGEHGKQVVIARLA